MAKKNHAKKALISSLLALFICFTMLIGTTFAWFTDTAVSSNNIIKSGTLDVEMSYKEKLSDNEWTDASTGAIFNYELWEPGYVQVRHIKIENKGNLALQYQISIVPNGEVSKLADVIDVYYVDPAVEVTDRAALTADYKLGTLTEAIAGMATTAAGYLLPAAAAGETLPDGFNSEETITIALKMREDAGNEYQNLEIGTDFAVQLVATQYTYEKDSFDDQYDKDAEYPVNYDHFVDNSADLVAAFGIGGNIKLEDDITLEGRLNLAEGKEVYLNMNGKTLTLEGTSVDPAFYTYKGSTLTIDGNGRVEIKDPSVSLIFPGGDVVIKNGTFIREVPAGTLAKDVGAFFVGAKVSPWGSQTVTINGGYFDGGYYDASAADIEELLAGTKTLEETADDIAKRGVSTDKNAVRVALKSNTQLTLNLSYNLFKVYGGTFVGMNPAWGDEGCMLPTTPNYLRPWSYYQGALLDGQEFNENGIVLPAGYEITKGATDDGRPTYTVKYNK